MVFVINMRVFKTVFTLGLTLSNLVSAGPASFLRLEHRTSDDDGPSLLLDNIESPESTTASAVKEDVYDQRQNGTENYRIHVDGFVLVVAPVEGLLLAGGLPGGSNDLFPGLGNSESDKPEPKPEGLIPVIKPSTEDKPSNSSKTENFIHKSMHKSHTRLLSLLAPFLRRMVPH